MTSDATDLAGRLKRIQELTDRYLQTNVESAEAQRLAERIKREMEAASRQIDTQTKRK